MSFTLWLQLLCDKCKRSEIEGFDCGREELIQRAISEGWEINKKRSICPSCQIKQRKQAAQQPPTRKVSK